MPRKRTTRLQPATKPAGNKIPLAEGISENHMKEQLAVFLRDYDCRVNQILKDFEKKKSALLTSIESRFENYIAALPSDIKDMTIEEFAMKGVSVSDDLTSEDVACVAREQDSKRKRLMEIQNLKWMGKSLEDIKEEGSDGPVPASTSTTSRPKGRQGRAAPRTAQAKKTTGLKSQFATPLNTAGRPTWGATPLITPKFDPSLPFTPENIRDMKPGERLMSLAGSPVQVGLKDHAVAVNKDEIAQELSDIAGVGLTSSHVEQMLRLLSTTINKI